MLIANSYFRLPRFTAYVRNPGPPEWRGCEDPVGPAWALFRRLHPRHLRSHFHPDAAGCGSEGRWIPEDEYVRDRRTVKYHTFCRKITIRRNKFPVRKCTGKNFTKKGKFRTSNRKHAFWISGIGSHLGQIWVKSGFGDGFDPNRKVINLGQLEALLCKNSRICNFCNANTAVFGGRSSGIRTRGLLDPNQARYQASPCPD